MWEFIVVADGPIQDVFTWRHNTENEAAEVARELCAKHRVNVLVAKVLLRVEPTINVVDYRPQVA